jgi:hypothetical protein
LPAFLEQFNPFKALQNVPFGPQLAGAAKTTVL